ncbi:hypothetical protein [Zavarzinella formosa]|uniref:hypothetical protein n=1 Tax=Zavarzinella formosa TaxID=360055 RepID=UPI0002E00F6B|nr:hypothetical protein [Zavarzinella formosa]
MTKLQHIGQYVINPANIAFMAEKRSYDGNLGTRIHFNAYAACANEQDSHFEALHLDIPDIQPLTLMEIINNEPVF